jgi:hypothetical protein
MTSKRLKECLRFLLVLFITASLAYYIVELLKHA